MQYHRSRGMTLMELMVLVLVIAVLMAIAAGYLQSGGHDHSPRMQCQNNMRNIGLALVNFMSSKDRLPNAGTFHDDPEEHQGDPLKSSIYRAITDPSANPEAADDWRRSWVVEILPYIDSQDMYNSWNFQQPYHSTVPSVPLMPSNALIAATAVGILRCSNDPTAVPGLGNLSYVVNGGFSRWHALPVGWSGSADDGKARNGGVLQWTPAGGTWEDNMAVSRKLGVMFLGTDSGEAPWDIVTRPADITDGLSTTLMVGENTLAGYSEGTPYSGGRPTNWACPLPNFAMFVGSDDVCRSDRSTTNCLAGQLRPGSKGEDGKGWARANQAGTFENVNFGQSLKVEGSFPFANSAHPGGSNFAFCDGAVRFVSNTIDGTVYAKVITPAGMKLPPDLRHAPVNTDHFAY